MQNKTAFKVIIYFGFISLFGDIIYEGARSVNGSFLEILGASAFFVGIVAGAGEFLNYFLRILSGYISDKTGAYRFFTALGYLMIAFIPLLSIANTWKIAALFILLERMGKALRSPARDVLLSSAAKEVGTGFGFGIHEAFDQIGAILGPLIFVFFFLGKNEVNLPKYQGAYKFLWIPFILLVFFLFFALGKAPQVSHEKKDATPSNYRKIFRFYLFFIFFVSAGFASYILIAYHFKKTSIFKDAFIPLIYAVSMGVDAIAAPFLGFKTKKSGISALFILPAVSALIPVFVFLGNVWSAILGMVLWGVVMAGHETILRAVVADLVPLKKRGIGYGMLNAVYGAGIFIGNAVFGFLYAKSLVFLILAVVLFESLSVLVLFKLKEAYKQNLT